MVWFVVLVGSLDVEPDTEEESSDEECKDRPSASPLTAFDTWGASSFIAGELADSVEPLNRAVLYQSPFLSSGASRYKSETE
jgi:hypothetical protein